ncbi:MAG: PDZ domain-containing protein [Ignavibacteria bacterium]|nr:PDZ domain-containing protein [Ignavibacteria bacterium]
MNGGRKVKLKGFLAVLSVMIVVGFVLGYAVKSATSANPPVHDAADVGVLESGAGMQQVSQQSPDDLPRSRENAITRAVARVSPAVVGINVTEVRQFRDPFHSFFGDDPFFRQFFGDRTYKQEVKGIGSGFIISPDGYIVTNDHVAGNAAEITVTLTSGERLKAQIVGSDPVTDICLLKVEGRNLPSLTFGNSDEIIIGEWSIALGNPFGLFEINDKPTVTVGVISSTGMNLGRVGNRFYRDMIETDAAINGGNSGGPLVNGLGEVIGVNTLIFTGGQSSTYVGYGFAIPINKVKSIVNELRKSGKVGRQGYTGFEAQVVDVNIARYFGLARAEGIIISEIHRGGPSERAGLRVGDIILEINGKNVKSDTDFLGILYDSKPGETWEMKIFRDKRTISISLRIDKDPQ